MKSRTLGLLSAILALGIAPSSPPPRAYEKQPRRFTDARKAEAQAKRERKAAKRRKENT